MYENIKIWFFECVSVCMCSFNRDWRYHKEERVWITRAPGMEPTLKTNSYERGTYYFFDCLNWRKVAKVNTHTQNCVSECRHQSKRESVCFQEFHLEYDKLDERPHVPSTFNYNPAQQAFWLALPPPACLPLVLLARQSSAFEVFSELIWPIRTQDGRGRSGCRSPKQTLRF